MARRPLFSLLKPNHFHIRYNSNEGIKYHGFTYYPRFPDEKDPPYEPTKLLMVQRVKPLKGNPYWDKKLLKHFGLDGKQSDIAVVKNIPEVNAILWKIKHLVKITPIQCPNGLPEEGDYEGTYLTDYGEFRISPRLKIDPKQIEATEEFVKDPRKFDGETLRKLLRLKWLNGW
ncbi:39S ribosomal protein L30, mitochondrial [Zootermopsis nevadensis]|uniref:Large ribosomal subunit protein uL30m n=1 Tax=Zootermopsis nevadensis TaxID=136037 RepID=A0A067QYE9_ZOONE|nr:39S ribosomal protein L30, mitochondrial [Zootermopsis nevadensis]KDR09964.1 39S ribosomal protein L30, mitochondrial [Zootermopsis nevadensis]